MTESSTMTSTATGIPCPACGEAGDVILRMDCIRDHADRELLRCKECDGEWSVDDLEEMIARYTTFVAWVKQAPFYQD